MTSLNLIIKSDVLGSLEAIISSLIKLEHPEVSVNIIAKGLGNITEGDIRGASAGKALVLGFHVKVTQDAADLAREQKVDVRLYEIIYKLIEEIKDELEKLLKPDVIKTELGRLKVLAIFKKEKNSMIVGGQVTKGKIISKVKVDVFREKRKLATGQIVQLQTNKVDVNEVSHGQECGVTYEGKPIIEEGDNLEAYTEEIKEKKIG